jgi:hypothetical protein
LKDWSRLEKFIMSMGRGLNPVRKLIISGLRPKIASAIGRIFVGQK